MFTSLGLFGKTKCPDIQNCKRSSCLFSHNPDAPAGPEPLEIPIHATKPQPQPQKEKPKPTPSSSVRAPTIPSKRSASEIRTANGVAAVEPPRKISRVGSAKNSSAIPTSSQTPWVPVLKIPPAQSLVAIPVRQAMLKSLYDHFVVLYDKILPKNPTIAGEHSLRQEQEVYEKSNKLTYRNAVISSIAALKRRSIPQSVGDPTVGTEGDLAARLEAKKAIQSLRLTSSHLQAYLLTKEEMSTWGYVVDIPEGPGGDKPSEEGGVMKCERCKQPKQVRRMEEAEECIYHWGRLLTKKVAGEKVRQYTCCSVLSTEDGCVRGPHVFYESDPAHLHRRHAFTHTLPPDPSQRGKLLEVAALDCEMIYTTGGMRVARVSAVDGDGKEVFDKHVRMDEGVHVVDFNTRFSGITEKTYSTSALQPLAEIRKSLDELISSETILIGHALENDLKTLRMVHHRNVDTAIIFQHPAGPPYRRALRDLVKEHLGKAIQTGGANVGHSSLEDSIATLDLVKWHVINKPPPPRTLQPPPSTTASASETPSSAGASTSTPTRTFARAATSSSAQPQKSKPPPTAADIPF